MNWLLYTFITIFGTLFRFFPLPCRIGIVKIGNPNRNSPVLLTCNFCLTVSRVKRSLGGLDAYLLIANSRGINVWCAATGGLFTNHDVISILKVSGIEELVDHRKVILPQLAGTGIEAKTIRAKTGWHIIWGPVYAQDIPEFLRSGLKKDNSMRKTKFDFVQRIEMAIAWAFMISFILSLVLFFVWRNAIMMMIIFVWTISLLLFLAFPLYQKLFQISKSFGTRGFQLASWVFVMSGLMGYHFFIHSFTWGAAFRWGILLTLVVLAITIDILGCTPTFKSGFHRDRLLKIVLDESKCQGDGTCAEVCPRHCFEIYRIKNVAKIECCENCVQCGACIVQCPYDALYFQSPKGEIITAELIRKYKLNLIGERIVEI
ncbi:MAG TPA: HgcAB-like fusion protein [bacterium]